MSALCYPSITDGAAQQTINSIAVYEEYLRVKQVAQQVQGGMYWKRQGTYEYLVRTSLDNRQQRLGPRSPETESIHDAFIARKQAAMSRLASLSKALEEAERLNRAIRAGCAPNTIVALLRRFQEEGLAEHFVVVGPQAVYAYEAAAGVRITSKTAGQAAGWRKNVDSQISFITDLTKQDDTSIECILQRVDRTFSFSNARGLIATNTRGFRASFLRSQSLAANSDPELCTWSTPRFTTPVVAANGAMATMQTISPTEFMRLMRLQAAEAVGRQGISGELSQDLADVVQHMLNEGFLVELGRAPISIG